MQCMYQTVLALKLFENEDAFEERHVQSTLTELPRPKLLEQLSLGVLDAPKPGNYLSLKCAPHETASCMNPLA